MYVCTNVCICGFVTHMICGCVCWCAWYACVGTTVCMWCSVAQCHDVLLFGVCGDIFATVDVDVASRMNYCFACVSPDLRICSFDCWHFLGLTPMVSSPLSGWSWATIADSADVFFVFKPRPQVPRRESRCNVFENLQNIGRCTHRFTHVSCIHENS